MQLVIFSLIALAVGFVVGGAFFFWFFIRTLIKHL